MSSNIRVKRICQHCKREFEARKVTSKTCSDHCSKMFYKAKQRVVKIEVSNLETHQVKTKPIEEIKAKEFLTVRDVAKLLNSSRQTIYNLIQSGNLIAVNIKLKKTLIKRSEIDKLFEISEPLPIQYEKKPEAWEFKIEECYNLTEVQHKYSISEKALCQLIKRNEIPKIKKGWYAYVPKNEIDKLLT